MSSEKIDYGQYYKLKPGSFSFEHDRYYPYSVNSLGFRGRGFLVKKAEGEKRICAFGGSSTFGYGVEDNETYPYYVEEFLNRYSLDEEYKVINCGFPAYRMKNIYNLFKKEVAAYEPDVVTVYSAWNDTYVPELISKKEFCLAPAQAPLLPLDAIYRFA